MTVTKDIKHSKYYYEHDRNMDLDRIKKEFCETNNTRVVTFSETADIRIPDYYIGKYHGYEARKVVEDFELSYNLATAVTYLLRADKKHETPIHDIKKAIAHLEFELEKIEIEEESALKSKPIVVVGGKL